MPVVRDLIAILEDMDQRLLANIDYIEAHACSEGCLGGILNVENTYFARTRIKKISSNSCLERQIFANDESRESAFNLGFEYKPLMKLDLNFKQIGINLNELTEIDQSLPGLDCGSCGAPSCRTLAEDIARGLAAKEDCILYKRNLEAHFEE